MHSIDHTAVWIFWQQLILHSIAAILNQKMSVKSTVVLSLLCAASAKEWSLNSQTSASVVAGVGAGSDTVAAAAASQNGVGAVVERLSGAKWTKKAVQTGMLLDTAVTPSGVTVGTSIWKVFVSTDGGDNYNVAPVNGVSQSANTWGSNKENLALVGNWVVSNGEGTKPDEVSGVATSTDSGATWKLSAQVPPAYARYGAFPSDNTWYVASGIWGSSADNLEGHRFSSRMHLDKRGYSYNEVAKGNTTALGASGWFGAVSKTTDGGATWTQVFTTNEEDVLYFNGISCSSETHCVVVAEGYNADGCKHYTLMFFCFVQFVYLRSYYLLSSLCSLFDRGLHHLRWCQLVPDPDHQ